MENGKMALILWYRLVHLLQLLQMAFISAQYSETQEEDRPPPSKPEQRDASSFIKLTIEKKYLEGARWEVETKQTKDVFHAVEVVDISEIDVRNGDFRLDLNIRQRWSEENLVFPDGLFLPHEPDGTAVTADSTILDVLWVPDLYIPNAKQAAVESLVSKHSNVIIFKNKTIIFYATVSTALSCPMSFQWYPLDIQHCEIQIESYTYTVDKVIFRWEDSSPPVTIPENLRLRRYMLGETNSNQDSASRFGRSDMYSRITITFRFEHELGHHLITIFIPTFLIVSLSWFSFWLGLDAIPARVGLLVTCMLTIVTLYNTLKGDLPPVSYVKILDIWMATCLLFIFAAMSEFIVVRTIHHMHKDKDMSGSSDDDRDQIMVDGAKQMGKERQKKKESPFKISDKLMEKYGHRSGNHVMPSPSPYAAEFYSPQTMRNVNDTITKSRRTRFATAWDVDSYEDNYDSLERLRVTAAAAARRQAFTPESAGSADQLLHVQPGVQGRRHTLLLEKNSSSHWRSRGARRARSWNKNVLWEKFDICSRIVFPLLFLCFCLVYWPILILGSRVQKGE